MPNITVSSIFGMLFGLKVIVLKRKRKAVVQNMAQELNVKRLNPQSLPNRPAVHCHPFPYLFFQHQFHFLLGEVYTLGTPARKLVLRKPQGNSAAIP